MKKILCLCFAALMMLSIFAGCAPQEDNKLVMATNAAFPPYEFKEGDSFKGIDVEIAQAIAKKLNMELVIEDVEFGSVLTGVAEGRYDMGMAGITVTDERKLTMDFSETYATGIQVVIVPEGSDVTLDNLGEKMIGTQRGTTGNIYCTDDFGEEHVVAYDDGIAAVQALMNGQVDCVVIDNAPAQAFVAANAGLTILDTEYVVLYASAERELESHVRIFEFRP